MLHKLLFHFDVATPFNHTEFSMIYTTQLLLRPLYKLLREKETPCVKNRETVFVFYSDRLPAKAFMSCYPAELLLAGAAVVMWVAYAQALQVAVFALTENDSSVLV